MKFRLCVNKLGEGCIEKYDDFTEVWISDKYIPANLDPEQAFSLYIEGQIERKKLEDLRRYTVVKEVEV